jgi:hypothetical protein
MFFRTDKDRLAYLETVEELRQKLGLKVYGYCLMSNHVHLIIDPGADAENLSLLMKRLAGRHTPRINRLEKKTGTSWARLMLLQNRHSPPPCGSKMIQVQLVTEEPSRRAVRECNQGAGWTRTASASVYVMSTSSPLFNPAMNFCASGLFTDTVRDPSGPTKVTVFADLSTA